MHTHTLPLSLHKHTLTQAVSLEELGRISGSAAFQTKCIILEPRCEEAAVLLF